MSEEVRNVNYVGIDIGSTASKVVVRGTSDMQFVLPTGWSSKETTQTIKEKLKENDVDVLGDETKVVATGYGRIAVDFADYVITEITCHARGGRELAGGDCTVIDVGGQDTKVILIENGMVQDFLMNDKCSAGTGKFLEIMANRLGVIQEKEGDDAQKYLSEYADPNSQRYADMLEAIRKEQNFTTLRYHRLDDLIASIGLSPCKVCTYCFNGVE